MESGGGLEKSRTLHRQAETVLPGGVNSNFRLDSGRFFQRGKGARLWDVDGNEYIDYVLGLGPAILGHGAESVWRAVSEATAAGMVYGAQHPLELEAAQLFCKAVRWPEMVRFGMTGTEAVQAGLRLARASTGRMKFVRFEGHYHGWLDNVLLGPEPGEARPASAGQLPEALDACFVLEWNNGTALSNLLDQHADEICAVMMEPVMLNSGSVVPRTGYLEQVRELCDKHGVLLIFDETITGFRVALGGAAARLGVTPDLAIYGKALGGGWPVSALAGRGDLMERFGTGEVNHSGTFNGNVMSMAATVATLTILRDENPYPHLEKMGTRLMDGLCQLAKSLSLPLQVVGLPMAFHVSFGRPDQVQDARALNTLDTARYTAFTRRLAKHGVWLATRGIWYMSAAHQLDDIELTLSRVEAVLSKS